MAPVETVFHPVYGMSQPTENTCWLTALTVMVNWRKGGSLDPEAVAQAAGYSIHQCDDGSWDPIYRVAEHWDIHPFLYTPVDVAAWADVLREHGPLWIVVTGSPTHTVILHGLEGDGTFDHTTATVTDSWDGVYTESFADLMNDFGSQSGQIALESGTQIMCF
jgi:hypothetical protein